MRRPRIWIRRVADCTEEGFEGEHQWQVMCGDKVADTWSTREEARDFARGYDPAGFYCLHCDEPNPAKELPDIWPCKWCGRLNDWKHELDRRAENAARYRKWWEEHAR